MINKEAVFHISGYNDCYPMNQKTMRIRLKTKKNDLEKVVIVYQNVYSHIAETLKRKPMNKFASDQLFDYFESDISLEDGYFKYYFELYSTEQYLFTQDGFLDKINEKNYFYYSEAHQSDVFNIPAWAKGIAIYQVIIDRFYRGNKDTNHKNCKPWKTLPDRNTYYGGDFKGVTKKLDYIKGLGMDAIYLNPVHPALSYHQYDITNYELINEAFGDINALKELIDQAHEKGLKIILDGVFNHCSYQHEFFQDLLKNQEKSEYCNWFKVHDYPVTVEKANYDNFGNLVPIMPKFDTSNEAVIAYLTSVAQHWTESLNIDGWRLDVGDELSHEFLRIFRKKIKSVNPNILIIGESWNIASRFMLGDQFDTVTNYKNRNLILDLVNHKLKPKDFLDRINYIKMQYKSFCHPYLINLIGSHDTIRLASYFKDEKKRIIALIITMFLEGGVILYYGDEAGLLGLDDPDNRRSMNWDLNVEGITKKVLHIRKATEFYKGSFSGEVLPNHCLSMTRTISDGAISFIVNLTKKDIKLEYKDHKILLTNRKQLNEVLKPFDFIILKK